MAESIQSVLTKYINKTIDIEHACTDLKAWSLSHLNDDKFIQYGTELLSQLYDDHKIGEGIHQRMLYAIQAPQNLSSETEASEATELVDRESSADGTKVQPDENDEATVLLNQNQAVAHKDATKVIPEGDITKRSPLDDDEDDITITGYRDHEDDDSTVISDSDQSLDDDDDVTVIAGSADIEDDDDATVISNLVNTSDDSTLNSNTGTTSGSTTYDDDASQAMGTFDDDDEEKTQIATPAEMTGKTGKTRNDSTDMTGRNEDFGIIHSTDDEEGEELVVGSILKDRFNLVSILGEGGMGLVFKAVDMLKVEAKDQNPYVAIKVLTGDFKEHPDAFISLQRETSKAQKLAHPNISTVYDFDRHKGTVYMTMELLNGEPLDEFIKEKMPKDGLPEKLALSIVKGLGEGLAYAHDQGLVHSDFKPGNAFIIDPEEVDKMDHIESGGVKVIDFGIARAAATTTGEKSLHEDEVFDAGSLGALTPAYATIEMYNGDDPHPSDDIYALACVAVQLLTGGHPYKKKPAPKAKEMKLRPPLIPGFTKRQQRALEKGLAFERKDRTENIEEFLDGIRRRKDYTWQIIFGLLLTFSLIGGLGYKPVTKYYEQQEIQEVILATNQGSDNDVKQTLKSLSNKSEEYQTSIKVGIRDRALEVYVKDINSFVDPDKKRYEYEKAEATIDDILGYYPDSSVISEISTRVSESKQVLLGELRESFITQLKAKNFLPISDEEDMVDVLKLLQRVNSDDPIFEDPRLEAGYYKAATTAIKKADIENASIYLDTANRYLTKSKLFNELNDQIKLSQIQPDLVKEQSKTEDSFAGKTLSIHDFKSVTDDLLILSLNSEFRSNQYRLFRAAFDKEFNKLVENSSTDAKDLYTIFSKALPSDQIISYIEKTGLAPKLSDNISASSYPRIHFINEKSDMNSVIEHITELRSAVAKHRTNLQTHYNANFEPTIDPLVTTQRASLIEFYNKLYSDILIPETSRAAASQITKTRNNILANVKNVYALANVENDKRIFTNLANENRLLNAISTYESIAKVATDSDKEFLDYAKAEIARMYVTLAESNATEYQFTNAYENITKAKQYLTNETIEKREKNYKKEVMAEEIAQLIVTREEIDKIKAQEMLDYLKAEYVDEYRFILDRISILINESIIELAKTELIDAHRLKKHALTLVNTRVINRVSIDDLPQPSLLAARGKIEVSQFNLSTAQSTLAAALAETPNHYQVDEFRIVLEEQIEKAQNYYKQYKKYYNEELYEDAETSLNSAITNWKDNPEYLEQRQFYNRIMRQVNAGGKLCREDLQGIGKRNRGACNDIVMSTKTQAPTMVVIPAINKDSKPYAISKYEISTANLNAFCEKSDKCAPASEDLAAFPATKVTAEMISEYADWLSKETGFDYSIASYTQWMNATSAAGREGNSDYNCRLRLGTKLIKGQNIVPVETGAQNNWGLINYVGNVDEIVIKDGDYLLVGGNYADSISDCKISLTKPYKEQSNTAGFRLVRSLF